MILTNKEIKANIKNGNIIAEGVTENQISQNSIDLSLGEYIFIDDYYTGYDDLKEATVDIVEGPNGRRYHKIQLSKDKAFNLYPDMFILAYANEWVGSKANTNLAWRCLLKSTAARNGLDHNMAGFVETGYFSPLCFEFYAHVPVKLKYGDLIAQAVFETTTDDSVDYSKKGSYQTTNDLEQLKKNWKPEFILPKSIKNKF